MSTLIVELTGFRNDRGHARVALYLDPADFPKPVDTSRLRSADAVISQGNATVTFSDLRPGPVAVAAFHDENDNGKMDTNFLGLPKEGYGFSNDPRLMRAPRFDDARVKLGEGETRIRIPIHYMPFS